jgi:hypothetical protein
MSKLSVEDQLVSIQKLRASGGEQAEIAAQLKLFLQQKNNLVVARAADLARDLDLRELLPNLATAFERFLDAAENATPSAKTDKTSKSDPQCWAKNALSKALHHLGCQDAGLFLRGMRTHQFEPVWGGQSDVAGTLRANCAHALVDCHELTHHATLVHLVDLVADKDKTVRAETMRAIAAAGGDGASLLLRLRALTASAEPAESRPEIMGHCYAGLLALEGVSAVPFVARFLEAQDDCSAEAALALGETRTPEALDALLTCLRPPTPESAAKRSTRPQLHLEPDFAIALLTGIALTRYAKAIDTLIELVATESNYAEPALEAIATANFGEDVKERLASVMAKVDNTRIHRTYQRVFPR